MLTFIKQFFLQFKAGLLPHTPDERDYKFSMLGGIFGYTPKHTVWEIPTLSVKNQESLYTCVFNAATVQKEVDEKVPLSVKYLVGQGNARGICGYWGTSTLRNVQQLVVSSGICEESLMPDVKTPWSSYANPAQATYDKYQNAALHKSKSFFLVDSKDEYIKALDEGHVIHTGCEWFTGYNMAGLDSTYTLKPRTGFSVGGHSFVCIGYNIPLQLFKFQNSYGESWGDHGCFYVKMSDWFSMAFAGYVSIDVPQETLWSMYEGKDVKGAGPGIYRIVSGKKCPFNSEAVFFKYGGKFGPNKTWIQISDSLLNSIPTGDPMV